MLFENKKITLIINSIFYGLLLLAGIGGFVYAAINPNFVQGNDEISILFISLIILGLPYFLYLKNEIIQNITLSDIVGVITKLLIYGLAILMFFYITNLQNSCKYIDIYCGALIATTLSMSLHDSYSEWSSLNSGYITTFALTIIGFALGSILYQFMNILVLYMIIGAFFIFYTIYISSFGDSSFSFYLGLGVSAAFFIGSIFCGINNSESLNYVTDHVNGFIFLPIIFVLYYFIAFVCVHSNVVKDSKVLNLLYPISAVALIIIQYIMVLKWIVGILLLLTLIITTLIISKKYATEFSSSSYSSSRESSNSNSGTYTNSYSSAYEDYDFVDDVKREIDSHINAWDTSAVSSSRNGANLTINITIKMYSRNDFNYYRNNIYYWVKPYKSYASKLSNKTTQINFNIDYCDEK